MTAKSTISLFALVMLMTGAVDGVSNLPAIGFFGTQLIFFFAVATLIFLVPVGLVSAEMCLQYPNSAGPYTWASQAYGSRCGLLVVWLQWVNTMVWFPTTLATIAGTGAYLLFPSLAHNPVYLVVTSLSIFWIMTALNLKGIKESSKIAAFASFTGMILPVSLIIGLSLLWLLLGKPTALPLTTSAMIPDLTQSHTWSSLTAVITAFLGMELATVHLQRIASAEKLFPRAFILTILIIMLTMGLGSLCIALIVPRENIILVTGTVQSFSYLLEGFNLLFLEKILGGLLIFGSIGAMVNWLISPAKGLAQLGPAGYLPKFLCPKEDEEVPKRIMILQGIMISLVSMAFILIPSVNGSYWLLLDMSTELYVMMYFIMFLVVIKHALAFKTIHLMPGGKLGIILVSVIGLFGCSVAITVGFLAPAEIQLGLNMSFTELFTLGLVVMISPAFLLMLNRQEHDKTTVLSHG